MPVEDYRNLPEATRANFSTDDFDRFDLLDPAFLSLIGWPTLLPVAHPQGQGRQPSCTAWAVGYAAATGTMRYAGKQLATPISPADLFTKILRRTPSACTSGSMISHAMDALVQEGSTTLDYAPYNDLQCGMPLNGLAYQLDGFSRIPANDGAAIRGALQMMQPVSFGMLVDARFQALSRVNPVYVPAGSGSGHAMTIVGYDNGTQRYKVMNSWGSSWGEDGTFWIAYVDFARAAMDVCIPYLRRAADNALLSRTTSNQSSPVTVQHLSGRRYGMGVPGSYGAGVEIGWSAPLDVRASALSVLDDRLNVLFTQDFRLSQIARGIRFGARLPDTATNYTYLRASVSGFDSAGRGLVLSADTRPASR